MSVALQNRGNATPVSATVASRTGAELASLEHAWRTLGVSYLDADFDYFSTMLDARPAAQAHVVMLESGGRPRALAVGAIERVPFLCRLGYKTLYRPRLRVLRIAHGGVSGADEIGIAAVLVESLESALQSRKADVLIVPAVAVGSPLDRALEMVPRLRRQVGAPTKHRRLTLPATYEELLAARDRKSRYNLKRQAETLEREFTNRLSVDVLSFPSDFDRIFNDLEKIARSTYQRGLGAGFVDTAERRALVRLALERGWFRAWILSIDGSPVAFWQGSAQGRTFYLNSTGYHAQYRHLGVGTYLQQRMLRDLCDAEDVEVVDFGWGDAEYKARFGSESWEEHDVIVFAPTVTGIRVSLLRGAIMGLDRGTRKLAARAGVTGRVKRIWRSRLRPGHH